MGARGGIAVLLALLIIFPNLPSTQAYVMKDDSKFGNEFWQNLSSFCNVFLTVSIAFLLTNIPIPTILYALPLAGGIFCGYYLAPKWGMGIAIAGKLAKDLHDFKEGNGSILSILLKSIVLIPISYICIGQTMDASIFHPLTPFYTTVFLLLILIISYGIFVFINS